jgi:pilus assembly protein CpaE
VLRKKNQQGKIITVFSTKGGVGKTFISTNLAVSLAQHTKEKVVLVDLDLDFGNVALALNLVPRYTIADVINEIRNLDQELMEGYLVPHRSGIKVLAANAQPQTTDFVNAEHIEFMIKVLQSTFDYLVIDMPARFHEPVDPVFQLTDLLLLVTTQEVSTIRNIKASLAALNSWSYPQHKIKLVLNKAESHSDIKIKDVETTLDRSLFGMVPAEYKPVSSSLNKGIPAVLLYPRAKVSRGIQKLTHGILGNGQEKKKTGFLKAKK